jgi:hypothetical protein
MRTLVIPPAAQRDEGAVQMLSAWIAENGLHCVLNVGMWKGQGLSEPDAWGILLADAVRHIANALAELDDIDAAHASGRVLASLQAELNRPTSPATGGFHSAHQ